MSYKYNQELMRLLTKIYDEKGIDFTRYKSGTILRRIKSRLNAYKLTSIDAYIKVLQKNKEEYNKLIDSLTINVTEFFRNKEAFNIISQIVIPRVIYSKKNKKHKIIKAWSCGCSNGDEAYSLAILLSEQLGNAADKFILRIIGSDVDKNALKQAKNMIYSENRLKALSAVLRKKYFTQINEKTYRLKENVSKLVIFKQHNVINDKPFLHCDIILCRNLLIYFNKELQEETILKFNEALNYGGYLVLGMVETLVGTAANLFEHIDNKLRIYRRPDNKNLDYNQSNLLSQKDIDKVVAEILGNK